MIATESSRAMLILGNSMNDDKNHAHPAGTRQRGSRRDAGTDLSAQTGSLGVFHSDKTGSGGFTGGFVACRRNIGNTACE